MAEFFLPIPPPRVTHQQKKVAVVHGRPWFYEPQRLQEARQALMLALHPHRPKAPLKGPVGLWVRWQFLRGKHKDGAFKTTRPDLDNMQKLLLDCMTDAGFWLDDAQVCAVRAEKVWSGIPGIWASVEEIRL